MATLPKRSEVAVLFAQETGAGDFWWTVAGLVSLPVLLGMNAFFVAAEFALVAVRPTRIEEMVSRGVKGAAFVQAAIQHLDRSIAATQLGITLSSIGLGFFAEQALASLLTGVFSRLPVPWDWLARHTVSAVIAFAMITFLHVVIGELIPKSLALMSPTRIAIWVAAPLYLFALATRPLILIMNGTGNMFLRWIGACPAMETLVHSVEELALLIEDTEEAGVLNPEQAEMVQNVFRMSNKKVADCMVPRDKMASLELTTPSDKVLEAVRSGAHTRMPIYDRELDNIVGVVNTKNLFYLFSLHGVVILEDAIYPALFLKPNEEIANALRLFRKARRPMALVRDDDGKIHGLITMEDILEEIIGDIEDEHDQPVPRIPRSRLRKLHERPPEKKK
ncbi:MAG: HlyC/CorC family transporter [Gemmataceae bacterium]|nr:HlyC/CorC family transporter [Gemmataceae bacterium]